MTTGATHCYVGKTACGCYVAVVVDVPRDPKWVARQIADLARSGLAVERYAVADRPSIRVCPHQAKPEAKTSRRKKVAASQPALIEPAAAGVS